MDFVFYNLSDDLKPHYEVHTVMPLILFSEKRAHLASHITTAGEMSENDLFTKNPKRIADLYVSTVSAATGMEETALKIKDAILLAEKLGRKKFKTKIEMQLYVRGKKIENDAKNYVQKSMHNYAVAFEMHRVNPFIRSKLLSIRYVAANRNLSGADDESLIASFQDVVSETEFGGMMVCAENLMQGLKPVELPGGNYEADSFTRLKMFPLPGFLSLKKSGYMLMREEMRTELQAWWKALQDTAMGLSTLTYGPENFDAARQKVMEQIEPASQALAKKLEASIYIRQLANNEYGEYGSTMYFAFTSRLRLLKAYHATKQIPDEVMNTLEQYYSSRNLNDKICCFLYHHVPDYPPVRSYHKDMQDEWDKLWQDSWNGIENNSK